jgi:hypothetical protein
VKFRGVHLRAVLVPLGVAIVSIAALAWYGLEQIPAQQQYLNERNLRLLRTLGEQIRSKVNNFDGAIDHAKDSFRDPNIEGLGKYVRLFAPELEILETARLDKDKSSFEYQLFQKAGDPPVVDVQRDEGRNYLYLAAKPSSHVPPASVLARTDIEKIAAAYLMPRTELDALFLTTKDGRVIAQQSAAGLNLARVDQLPGASQTNPTGADQKQASSWFERLRATSNVTEVTVAGALYKLYLQPVQLSLGSFPDEGPQEWELCGLVSAARFKTESSAISYTYLLWFSAAVAAIWFAIPFVKLRGLGARERLRAVDGGSVALSTFSMAGLLTLGALDVYVFGRQFDHLTDERLQTVGSKVVEQLKSELRAIESQMREFDKDVEKGAEKDADKDRVDIWERAVHLKRSAALRKPPKDTPKILLVSDPRWPDGERPVCNPKESCEPALLEKLEQGDLRTMDYPYFDLVTWTAEDGSQRVKWSTSRGITPFINAKTEQIPYVILDLQRA